MKDRINIPHHNLGAYIIPEECKRGTCVDVGANVGSFTLLQAGSFKTVHYYEPYEECYNVIYEKVKGLDNVTGWQEAVYYEDETEVSLVHHSNFDAGSNAIKTDAINKDWGDELQKVKTVSFSTILERIGGHIDYLKVDCETSEYYFLIDQDLKEVDYIGIELHHQMGKYKYDLLLTHLAKTHISIGDCRWEEGLNKEVLFKPKSL